MGHVYNALKKHFKFDDGVHVKTGHVELLHELYRENTFDIVHMKNSLDHCFDPLYGLQELLYICKVGGKIILRHAENEAVTQKYHGLHQWNLSLFNEEDSFVIWRNNERYDIRELFFDFAEFELYPKGFNKNSNHNIVVMTKTNRIDIPDAAANYGKIIHECNYEFLLEILGSIRTS